MISNIDKNLMPSNKKFGYSFFVIFIIIFFYFFIFQSYLFSYFFLFLATLTLITAIFFSSYLKIFNYLWFMFGILLGKIVSPIVLGLIFFVIFTPVSLFLKIIKRDELQLKKNNDKSYWKIREEKKFDPNSFKNQF